MQKTEQQIWFITGVSSGFGRCLVEEVVARGHYVIGTLRKPEEITEFNRAYQGRATAIPMDLNHRTEIENGVHKALALHKRIDILVNNAGYGLFGAIEEADEQEARHQMETNFFGPLFLTQMVLPFMRQAGSGYIIQISSIAGFCSAPGLGLYNASKYALEGFSEALALEVAPLGIKVLIVEPGPFRTKWAGKNAQEVKQKIEDYNTTAHATTQLIRGYSDHQPGDPKKAAQLIIEVIQSSHPPLRLPLGQMAHDRMNAKIASLQKEVSDWETKSLAMGFEE